MVSLFENSSNQFLNNTAIISDTGSKLSYWELENFSKILSNKINPRSLVFSFNNNTLGSIIGYYSFIKNKVVPLMLDSKIDNTQVKNLISIYKPQYLWLPTLKLPEFDNYHVICSIKNYSLIKSSINQKVQLQKDLAILLSTSGSTGSPKFVKISYDNIKSNTLSIIKYLSIKSNEKAITTLPMSYSYGLSIINSHFHSGATVLLTDLSFFDKKFWNFLKNEKATSISGVPYTYEMLKKLRFTKMELPYLKTLTQAGGKMNASLTKEIADYCINNEKRLFIMYGQTEATARMSYLPNQYTLSKIDSIGIAIPRGKFSLVDESQNLINKSNVVGELVYEGPNVSMGYANCLKDLSKNDENNGKLFTGDLALRDDDDFYYIKGRKKRFLKIYGNRINLDETEILLKEIVEECACVGSDERVVVYITDETKIDLVKNFISSKLGLNRLGFLIKHIKSIPKNSSGKTIYSDLKIL